MGYIHIYIYIYPKKVQFAAYVQLVLVKYMARRHKIVVREVK